MIQRRFQNEQDTGAAEIAVIPENFFTPAKVLFRQAQSLPESHENVAAP